MCLWHQVSPIALGTMRVGSQFDPFVRVETFVTSATDILCESIGAAHLHI